MKTTMFADYPREQFRKDLAGPLKLKLYQLVEIVDLHDGTVTIAFLEVKSRGKWYGMHIVASESPKGVERYDEGVCIHMELNSWKFIVVEL